MNVECDTWINPDSTLQDLQDLLEIKLAIAEIPSAQIRTFGGGGLNRFQKRDAMVQYARRLTRNATNES